MILAVERMLRVELLSLSEEADNFVKLLVADGSMHLIDHRALKVPGFDPAAAQEGMTEEADRLRSLAEVLLENLGAERPDSGSSGWETALSGSLPDLLKKTRSELDHLKEAIGRSIQEREALRTEIGHLDEISEQIHLLYDNKIEFSDIAGFRRLFMAYGSVGSASIERLLRRLSALPCGVVTRQIRGRQTMLFLLGDLDNKAEFEGLLAEAGFRQRSIPERFQRPFNESLDLVELDLWERRDRLAELNAVFAKNSREWIGRLFACREAMRIQSLILKAHAQSGRSGVASLVSGFVPKSRWQGLRARMEAKAPGSYAMSAVPAEEGGGVKVPSRFRNARVFRPFEMLVRTYGIPGYNDVDPTPLLSISFLVMFGMMFGDVGHGAMLAAIGAAMAFLPYRALVTMRDLGRILIGAGVSGMIFGLLFGSVFGIEKDSVLPALWMRPGHPENLPKFMGAAVAVGVTVISTGIVLGIIQAFRRRDIRSALIGPWSACSLVFYWGLLLLLGLQLTGRPIPLPVGAAAAALAVPVLLIGVGQFALHIRDQKLGRHGGHAEADMATIAFEPIEVVMNLFSNSVSFLRVAAFGLAHAALTTAAFVVNDMVRLPGASILSLPLEHLFVVVLEGMIVTIQCLRLEYYEFFSKFFRGDGVAYAPLTAVEEE